MIKTIKKNVQKEVEEITDYICNMCGESCVTHRNEHGEIMNVDGLNANVCGGWGSKIIGDTVSYKFDLCEKCTMELIEKLKIPAEKSENPWMD